MDTDPRPVLLAFAGIFCGATALVVALLAADRTAAVEALTMVTYCSAEFLRTAALDVS